jgi:hypothetical protein
MVGRPIVVAGQAFYEVATARLADQMKQIETLDAKTDKILSYSAGALGIFGAALGLVGKHVSAPTIGLFVGAFVIYTAVIISTLRAYQLRNYSYRPDMSTLQHHAESLPDEALRLWVARECVLSLNENDVLISEKSADLARAIRLFPFQVLLLTAAALFNLL